MNVQLAVVTGEAKWSLPRTEANFATVVQQVELNSESSVHSSERLSSGKRASTQTVSRNIP